MSDVNAAPADTVRMAVKLPVSVHTVAKMLAAKNRVSLSLYIERLVRAEAAREEDDS